MRLNFQKEAFRRPLR